jgi:hypothetical protein
MRNVEVLGIGFDEDTGIADVIQVGGNANFLTLLTFSLPAYRYLVHPRGMENVFENDDFWSCFVCICKHCEESITRLPEVFQILAAVVKAAKINAAEAGDEDVNVSRNVDLSAMSSSSKWQSAHEQWLE